jgi:hypothetical protein
MPIDPRWDQLTPSDWQEFARTWLATLRGEPEAADSGIGQTVVMMNFMAAPRAPVAVHHGGGGRGSVGRRIGARRRRADGTSARLAWANYIDAVERQAAADHKFARMLATVQRYMMGDDVWARIEALKVPGDRSYHA